MAEREQPWDPDERPDRSSPLVGISILVGMVGFVALVVFGMRMARELRTTGEHASLEEVRLLAGERWLARAHALDSGTWGPAARAGQAELDGLFEDFGAAEDGLERELLATLRFLLAEDSAAQELWAELGTVALVEEYHDIEQWSDPVTLAEARAALAGFLDSTVALREAKRGLLAELRARLLPHDLTHPSTARALAAGERCLTPWVTAYDELAHAHEDQVRAILATMDALADRPDGWGFEDGQLAFHDVALWSAYDDAWRAWVDAQVRVERWSQVLDEMR